MSDPLPLPTDDWRSRWLMFDNSRSNLHRVSSITWHDPEDGLIRGDGMTVCGKSGFLMMPGIFSRMGLKRCPACCRAMGVPQGTGAPFNQGIFEPGDEAASASRTAAPG